MAVYLDTDIPTFDRSPGRSWGWSTFWLGAALLLTGCGVHYYDPKTGVEHLWGFGHLRMKVQPDTTNGVQAVMKGYQVIGVQLVAAQEDYGLVAGYGDRYMLYVNPTNAAFGLEWPTASFFNIRVTTNAPFQKSAPIPGTGPTSTTSP